MNTRRIPRVLLLADQRGWAFHTIARAITKQLAGRFDCETAFVGERPDLKLHQYDLLHVLYEQETYHVPFLQGDIRIVGRVVSHEWEAQGMSAMGLYRTHLRRCDAVLTSSLKLLDRLADVPVPVRLYAAGVATDVFYPIGREKGEQLIVGWAGNPHLHRTLKNLSLLERACAGLCELHIAGGDVPYSAMPDFYRDIDVIVCCSRSEGNPNTLLEGMACGAFPVSFDVGIAPTLIEHAVNGLLVRDQTEEALRAALTWCTQHLSILRDAAHLNVERIRTLRDERVTADRFAEVYDEVLAHSHPPAWR